MTASHSLRLLLLRRFQLYPSPTSALTLSLSLSSQGNNSFGRDAPPAQVHSGSPTPFAGVPVAMSMNPFPLAKALWGMVKKLVASMELADRYSIDMNGVPLLQVLLPSVLPTATVPEVRRMRVRSRPVVGTDALAGGGGSSSSSAFIFNPFERKQKGGDGGHSSVARLAASRLTRAYTSVTAMSVPSDVATRCGYDFRKPNTIGVGELAFVAGSAIQVRLGLRNPLPIPLRITASVVVRLSSESSPALVADLLSSCDHPAGVPDGCFIGEEMDLQLPVTSELTVVRTRASMNNSLYRDRF
jgi:hypothetical protein